MAFTRIKCLLPPIAKLKSTRVKVKAEAKTEEIKYPTLMDPDSVRANAKKALYQILWKR